MREGDKDREGQRDRLTDKEKSYSDIYYRMNQLLVTSQDLLKSDSLSAPPQSDSFFVLFCFVLITVCRGA